MILDLEYVRKVVNPQVEDLKRRFFQSHPDDPLILHRSELVNQKPPFDAVLDPDIRADFDIALMALLQDLEYVVITAVIDKLEHLNRYHSWVYDPYHYCLTVILERYANWLRDKRDRST